MLEGLLMVGRKTMGPSEASPLIRPDLVFELQQKEAVTRGEIYTRYSFNAEHIQRFKLAGYQWDYDYSIQLDPFRNEQVQQMVYSRKAFGFVSVLACCCSFQKRSDAPPDLIKNGREYIVRYHKYSNEVDRVITTYFSSTAF
ncbi:MAG: hypothetical protein S4CHLAM45_02510 [Chlamydiales bacterium]|nr:hypothetical protein [Chlamydiales bacterium]MCH9619110.1 hypothetical protein [Chlamydiales bacterium]MCH9622372.1 hypothetical protein [Chlamydiales bacterium]